MLVEAHDGAAGPGPGLPGGGQVAGRVGDAERRAVPGQVLARRADRGAPVVVVSGRAGLSTVPSAAVPTKSTTPSAPRCSRSEPSASARSRCSARPAGPSPGVRTGPAAEPVRTRSPWSGRSARRSRRGRTWPADAWDPLSGSQTTSWSPARPTNR